MVVVAAAFTTKKEVVNLGLSFSSGRVAAATTAEEVM